MANFNQDDARETAMVQSLNLEQRPDRGRQDEDAHLDVIVGGVSYRLEFELKSTPANKGFGTGRDTGLRQLARWAKMHFVFAWFEPRQNQPRRMWYGSPAMMRAWNEAEVAYLGNDLVLLEALPDRVDDNIVSALLGDRNVFSFSEMQRLMKNQWVANKALGRTNQYLARADVTRSRKQADCQYSREVATAAVRERVAYLLARGATTNNRKISAKYVKDNCVELHGPRWADELQRAVDAAILLEPPA